MPTRLGSVLEEGCDVLLVTVTDSETDALIAALAAASGVSTPRTITGDRKTYTDHGRIGGARVLRVRCEMGAATSGGAQSTIGDAIHDVAPRAIIMVGIAFGVKGTPKQRIGTILVASSLQDYELQRIGTAPSDGAPLLVPRGARVDASPRLIDRLRHAKESWSGCSIEFGLVLSGDKLVDNLHFRERLTAQFPEAIGGEMEGRGLYVGAQDRAEWIVVKAICDWADGNKRRNKKTHQRKAATNAAKFVVHALQGGGFGPIPGRGGETSPSASPGPADRSVEGRDEHDERLCRYREGLAGEINWIDLRSLPDLEAHKPAIRPLSDSFVVPRLEDIRSGDGDSDTKTTRRVALHGEPGAGKSTLARALCLVLSADGSAEFGRFLTKLGQKEHARGRLEVPIYVRLAALPRPELNDPKWFDRALRERLTERHDAETAEDRLADIEEGRAFVCLDGLDEVPEVSRIDMARAIELWSHQRARDAAIWVTMRSSGSIALAGFRTLRLAPFNSDEVFALVQRRVLAVEPGSTRAAEVAEVWRRRCREGEMGKLLRVPLLLEFALALEDMGKALPMERVALFDGIIQALVGAWRGKRLAKKLLRALSEVALSFHNDLGRERHVREWERELAARLGGGDSAEAQAGEAIARLRDQGLLVPEGTDHLRLWHISLGEYLAAVGLARAAAREPARILETAGSVRGREIVLLALAWTRSIDGDPARAEKLVESLLDDGGDAPWQRLHGLPIQLAAAAIHEGIGVGEVTFDRLVRRALEEIARAPLEANCATLRLLVEANPRYLLTAANEALLRRLMSMHPPLLGKEERASGIRWLANVVGRSAEATEVLTKGLGSESGALWAALGMVSVGAADAEACLVIARRLSDDFIRDCDVAAMLRDELGWRVQKTNVGEARSGLRRVLRGAAHGDTTTQADRATQVASALVLGLLGEFDDEVLDSVGECLVKSPHSDQPNFRTGSVRLLANAAPTSEAIQRRVATLLSAGDGVKGDAESTLFGPLPPESYGFATEITAKLFGDPATVATAAAIVHQALASREAWLDPSAVLRGKVWIVPGSGFLNAIRGWIRGSERAALALVDAKGAIDPRVLWTTSALVVEQHCDVWRPPGSESPPPSSATERLVRALADPELARAVISASLLGRAWEHLDGALQRKLVQVWIRGLGDDKPRPDDDSDGPLGKVAALARDSLCARIDDLDDTSRRELHIALEHPEHQIRALVAETLLASADSQIHRRCIDVLEACLDLDEPVPAAIAVSALRRRQGTRDRLVRAGLRGALLGLGAPITSTEPAADELVELFLSVPVKSDIRLWRPSWKTCIDWLATNPGAGLRAIRSLASPDGSMSTRASMLLETWLDSPERITAAAEVARRSGGWTLHRFWCVLDDLLSVSDVEKRPLPWREAAQRTLETLLQSQLSCGDLALARTARRRRLRRPIGSPALMKLARRLLGADEPTWRIEEVRFWMLREGPSSTPSESARAWFGVELAEVIEALHPCAEHPDATLAIEAGLMILRLIGDSAPLRATAQRIAAGPAIDAPGVEPTSYMSPADLLPRMLLADEVAVALAETVRFRSSASSHILAAIAFLEIDDDEAARPLVTGLLTHEGELVDGWDYHMLSAWISEHRPGWWTSLDPLIAGEVARAEDCELNWLLDLRLRAPLSPTLASALAERWAESLIDAYPIMYHPLADFVAAELAVPDSTLQGWRAALEGTEQRSRTRAALALAASSLIDNVIVDVLIEAFVRDLDGWRMAEYFLRTRPLADVLRERRRVWLHQPLTIPQQRWSLALLWTDEETRTEWALLAPFLRGLIRCDVDWIAADAAYRFWRVEPKEGHAALVELAQRSDAAALILDQLDGPDAGAEARLWSMVEGPSRDWTAAALLLLRRPGVESRLVRTLASAVYDDEINSALWILDVLDHDAAIDLALRELADAEDPIWAWRALRSLARGQRPGWRPWVAAELAGALDQGILDDESDDESDGESDDESLRWISLSSSSTLEARTASVLRLDAADRERRLDLPRRIARYLTVDLEEFEALWRRASDGSASPDEGAALREVIDARADDTPHLRLARLWWLLRDPMAERLRLEELARTRLPLPF